MRRMRQIPGELPCGTCMAFLTRPDDILSAQMRTRIGNGKNVMGTVTVIALRGFCISELRHFAMIGIEIRFRNRLMTATALLHDLQFETGLIGSSDRVGRVAIITYRQWFVRLSQER